MHRYTGHTHKENKTGNCSNKHDIEKKIKQEIPKWKLSKRITAQNKTLYWNCSNKHDLGCKIILDWVVIKVERKT